MLPSDIVNYLNLKRPRINEIIIKMYLEEEKNELYSVLVQNLDNTNRHIFEKFLKVFRLPDLSYAFKSFDEFKQTQWNDATGEMMIEYCKHYWKMTTLKGKIYKHCGNIINKILFGLDVTPEMVLEAQIYRYMINHLKD